VSSPVVGRYSLERLVGRGSLGEVWEVRAAGLATPLALTLTRAANEPGVRGALHRDLAQASRVRSPHFAVPLDVVDDGEALGVVTELVRGRPLVSVSPLRGVPLLDAALALARAFEHLGSPIGESARAVVHGCLRPSSLLVDDRGRIVVTDLGLWRVSQAAAAGFVLDEDRTDPRTDLFSVGAVLFALAAETPPFGSGVAGAQEAARAHEHLAEPTFLARVDAALPGLGEVIRRCLHRRVEDRFASASDLASALLGLAATVDEGRPLSSLARTSSTSTPLSASQRSADPRATGPGARLPPPLRAGLLDTAVQRLRGAARFLFVEGAAGAGRTAFVGELARRLARDLPGGARWADVSRCDTAEDLACTVADALGAEPDASGKPARIGRILARRGRMLLALDGIDGARAPVTSTLSAWLAAAPEVTLVCTGTRPPPGAERIRLEGLDPTDAEAAWRSLRASNPEEDAGDVRTLAGLVDGLPQPLLVLARSPLPTAVALRRLRERLSLVPDAEPDRGPHAAFDVAIEALPEWGRAAVAQLSVFEGAFSLSQAAAVLDLSAWPDAAFAIGSVLLLEERGLLHRDRPRDASESLHPPRTARWWVHTAVRRWSLARASALDLELSRLRHRAAHGELGATDVERALATGSAGWRRVDLLAERWDLEMAARRASDDEDAALAARCFAALVEVGGGHVPAARTWALGREIAELPLSDADRVVVESAVADAAGELGRTTEQVARRQAALVAAAEAGDLQAEVLVGLSSDPSEVESALRHARRLGDPLLLGRVAVRRAAFLAGAGRAAEARSLLVDALRWAERVPDQETAATAARLLARSVADHGDGEGAVAHFQAAIVAWHALGEAGRSAPVEADLGAILLDTGRPDAALRHLVSAATTFRLDGNTSAEAAAHARLGEVSHWCGRFDGALRHLDDAQRLQRRLPDPEGLARTLGLLGLVHTETGRLSDARDALEEAQALGVAGSRTELELGRLQVSIAEGRPQPMHEALRRCLADARHANDPVLAGRSLWLLGRASFRDGSPDVARTQLEEAVHQLAGRALGWRVLAELDLANVLDAQGEGRVALDVLERAIAAAQAATFLPTFALALCARAKLHVRSGRAAEAVPDVAEARQVTKGWQLGARAPLARALDGLKDV
jgi:tetratricopeptide (TPR) repeat protein